MYLQVRNKTEAFSYSNYPISLEVLAIDLATIKTGISKTGLKKKDPENPK